MEDRLLTAFLSSDSKNVSFLCHMQSVKAFSPLNWIMVYLNISIILET